MGDDTVSSGDSARLDAERAAADPEGQQAPPAVDVPLPTKLTRPTPIPLPDDLQLPTLNRYWAARQVGAAAGWRRVRTVLARYVRPLYNLLPWRQSAFNEALVDHLNRASAREHAAKDATTQSLDGLHDDLGVLLAYLHTNIPAYMLALRLPRSLAENLSALSDEMRKRWESVSARQQRLEAAHSQGDAELRLALGLLQRSVAVAEREVERALTAVGSRASVSAQAAGETAKAQLADTAFTASRYVGFEDAFRGSREEIRERLASYLPLYSGASDVLDFGCGRGEFLDLLRQEGIRARGIDINHEMVELCRARGLDVAEGDGLAFLEGLPDGSLGGLFASQVVEHLQPDQLLRLVSTAFHKLRPGATVVLETINPACWLAFFESYLRDITHVRAIHPDTLKYLLQASGFQRVEIVFTAPVAEHEKLEAFSLANGEDAGRLLTSLAGTFNANVEKINRLVFTHLDYAAVAVRP
jgi:SAM-dependent methyltransferase